MKIIDGKKIAAEIKEELKEEISKMKENSVIPGLAVILVGEDSASKIYVGSKEKACAELGVYSNVIRLNEDTGENDLLKIIFDLNNDQKVHGILVQLPLPEHIDAKRIISSIDPKKDVDCFHPENIGLMFAGSPRFLPCTPAGVMEMLKRYEINVLGKDVTIVGRSNIVGKPLAVMLMNAGATVTVCHSKTRDLKEKTLKADIIISAAGRPGLITADMVQPESVVIDVGINRDESGKLVGDVDFAGVSEVAEAITPVPGGVGPMTIAMLMKNTVEAAKNSK